MSTSTRRTSFVSWPVEFQFRMWDNRPDAETFGNMMTMIVGADNPKAVVVPGPSCMLIRMLATSMAS